MVATLTFRRACFALEYLADQNGAATRAGFTACSLAPASSDLMKTGLPGFRKRFRQVGMLWGAFGNPRGRGNFCCKKSVFL